MVKSMEKILLKKLRRMMNNYTPSQLKEHLQWVYRQPNYYKENNWGGKRETNKDTIRIHEEWAKENGYR